MASYTPNLNLKKPDSSDAVNITDINGNMDILDSRFNGGIIIKDSTGKQWRFAIDGTNNIAYFEEVI
ncbi:hypothetical protein [Caldanaerobius polysaccharolyticus]|uniref:hypothetical protein n=1 Tax=Caldanaerobius polysaccharolyticus TaxID=44256 RepID=UPI000479C5CB|nr:hypothetical protein [Caldanaerobius polysaccharolyticus]